MPSQSDHSPGTGVAALTPLSRKLLKLIFCLLMLLAGIAVGDRQDGRPDPFHRQVFSTRAAAWLDWFFYPVERNGFLRPYFIEQNLTDIAMSDDGVRLWVVASRGKIIASDDAGRSWRNQSSGTTKDLAAIAMEPFGRCGWAVGDGGVVLATTNAGATWSPQQSGTPADLYSVTMLGDCRRGWIGGRDLILFTRDGGAHWQRAALPGAEPAGYIGGRLLAGETGLLIRQGYGLVKTEDAGATWSALAPGTTKSFVDAAMVAGRLGLGLGWRGEIGRTEDGGLTWRMDRAFDSLIPRIAMSPDAVHGIVVDRNGRIFYTDDAGHRWSEAINPLGTGLNAVVLGWDGRRGYAVGGPGTVIATDDGGRTWSVRMRGGGSIRSIFVAGDAATVWMTGDGPTLLKSDDRGRTWLPQLALGESWLHGTQTLRGFHMAPDGRRGWMAGDHDVFATEDGGRTWVARPVKELNGVTQFVAFDDGEAWLTGYPFGRVRMTTDAGASWRGSGRLTDFAFDGLALSADRRRVFAVGRGPAIARSTDAGQSWDVVATPNAEWLRDVTVSSDGMRGCAVGFWGNVICTTDGGASWTLRDPGTGVALHAVTIGNDGHGWAVGNYGTLLQTGDFGETWQQKPTPLRVSLTAISIGPDGRGFVGGFARNLMHTEDGGRNWSATTWGADRAPWVYAWVCGWAIGALWIALRPAR